MQAVKETTSDPGLPLLPAKAFRTLQFKAQCSHHPKEKTAIATPAPKGLAIFLFRAHSEVTH